VIGSFLSSILPPPSDSYDESNFLSRLALRGIEYLTGMPGFLAIRWSEDRGQYKMGQKGTKNAFWAFFGKNRDE
jgi:hypothetical protein